MSSAPRSSAAEEAAEPAGNIWAWWLAILLALYYALSVVDRVIVVHMVDLIKRDLSITDFQLSLVFGPAFGITYAVFSYPWGWAADRFQRRWIMFLAVAAWSLATVGTGFARSFEELVAWRVLLGVAEAAIAPTALSMLADRLPADRLATALGIYNTGPKTGATLAYVLAGLAIAWATTIAAGDTPFFGGRKTWQLVMFMIGAPGMVMAFLIWTVKEPSRRGSQVTQATVVGADATFLAFLRANARLVIPFVAAFSLAGAAALALTTWTPAFIVRTYGWSPIQYGPWMGAVSAVGGFSVVIKGAVVDWIYSRGHRDAAMQFYTWLLFLFLPLGGLSFFAPNPYVFFVCFLFLSAIAVSGFLYAMASIHLFTPQQFRGQMLGLLMVVYPLVSSLFGPTLTAGLTDFVFQDQAKLGWSLAIVTTGCMAATLILLRYVLRLLARTARNDIKGDIEGDAKTAIEVVSSPGRVV
ncbi:MFS transporter [Roseiarcaceae bacterium H3SJ34-1]|uniref:MFS transporter n=1 Tax=Terripilifer ovatus TaxID=3032367 RepID=UPI003AB959A6|nr:MFS transporter [Roseiarcaceae bacterium H3SJ34-1]